MQPKSSDSVGKPNEFFICVQLMKALGKWENCALYTSLNNNDNHKNVAAVVGFLPKCMIKRRKLNKLIQLLHVWQVGRS